MDYQYFVFINVIGCLVLAHNGLCQRLTFDPNPVTVGGTDQPGTTPQELVMECSSDGTSVSGVYYFHLFRAGQKFAEISSLDNNAKIIDNAPQDIRNKQPAVEGRVGTGPGNIRVRYQTSKMTCQDEAQYSCEMKYRSSNGEDIKNSDTEQLRLNSLPGDLTIRATRTINGFPQELLNQTTVQYNDEVQYMCEGKTGENSATVIDWFIWDPVTNMFGRYTQSVDDGNPGNACPYTRTSTLRYRVTTANRNYIVFRCQVSAQQHTAYSHEFHVRPPVLGMSSASHKTSLYTPLLAASVLALAYVTNHVITA